MAAELVSLASRKPDRRTASRDVAMELRAERHEDHEFARAITRSGIATRPLDRRGPRARGAPGNEPDRLPQ
jgi:hypothetical protein